MRILAGIDLSVEGHDWLLGRAVAYATAARATLDLVHVSEDKSRLAALEALLVQVPAFCRGQALLIPGDPLEELVRLSGEVDAMVIGPREPQGLERYLQGAMAVRILRRTLCPIIVPRTERFGQRRPRLLLGLDLTSTRKEYTVQATARIATWFDAAIVDAVYAMPRTMPPIRRAELREAANKEWATMHEPERKELERLLLAVDTPRRGDSTIGHGEPEDVLVADSLHYDLVLVGNRSRTGLQGLLLGSVAGHVVRNARSDVLILPTASQPDEWQDKAKASQDGSWEEA
jgi:nucleotide-binding universal stress UspA family protein